MAEGAPESPAGGAIPLSPAPVGGRRHLKKVSAKTIKRTLRKLGMKPKGRVVLKGGEGEAPPAGEGEGAMGGRRRRHTKKGRKHHRRSIFGMKY